MAEMMREAQETRRGPATALLHRAAIQALAEETSRPVEEIAVVYQCELVRLASHAAVVDYLPVLVMKRVRQLYRHRLEALHQDDPCHWLIPKY